MKLTNELEKLLKDKSISQEDRDYAEKQSLQWTVNWLKSRKPQDGPSTQSDPGDHPLPPPPHP